MDLYDAATSLQRAQDRYLCWREMRSAVTALPAGGPVPAWIRETAAAIQAGANLRNLDQAGLWIAASESEIRDDLRRARLEHWYQQGKALRYALILCRNRVDRLANDIGAPSRLHGAPLHDTGLTGPDDPQDAPAATTPPQTLRVLREQVEILGGEIAAWRARRRPAERLCSLRDLQAILADPKHPAEKEPLEDIIVRAQTAGLPSALPCIRFRWDTVSGEIDRADVVAAEGPDEAPQDRDLDRAA